TSFIACERVRPASRSTFSAPFKLLNSRFIVRLFPAPGSRNRPSPGDVSSRRTAARARRREGAVQLRNVLRLTTAQSLRRRWSPSPVPCVRAARVPLAGGRSFHGGPSRRVRPHSLWSAARLEGGCYARRPVPATGTWVNGRKGARPQGA